MTALRYRLKSFAWLALLAMCGVAFGPSISRMLVTATVHSGGMAAQHHMAMGSQSHMHMMAGAQTDPAENSNGPDHSSCLLDCCALCAVAASPFTGVAFLVPQWLPVGGVSPPPADHAGAKPDRRDLWSSAAPRGPPAIS